MLSGRLGAVSTDRLCSADSQKPSAPCVPLEIDRIRSLSFGAARQDIDVDWLFVGPFFRVRNNRVVPIPRCACSIEQVRGVQHLGLQTLAHCHRLLGMEAAPIDREGSRTFTSGSSMARRRKRRD